MRSIEEVEGHHDQTIAIGEAQREAIEIDTSNKMAKDMRFCIYLRVDKGWVTNIDLDSKGGTV